MAADSDVVLRLREELERSEQEVARIATLEHDVQHLRRRLEVADAEHAREIERLRADASGLRADLDRAHAALRALQSSPSWRLTRPLRALKHLRG